MNKYKEALKTIRSVMLSLPAIAQGEEMGFSEDFDFNHDGYEYECDLLRELVDKSDYIELLENMFILFSQQYSETQKILMNEAKENGSKLWMNIPTIQGSTLTLMIDRVAESTKTKGEFTYKQLKLLEENLKRKYGSDIE